MPIQIVENEDKKIEVTFEDGKKRSYYPGWQVILDVHSVQEAMQIQDETDEGVQAKRYITGTAVLQDRDISIIGEPDKKTRTLELGIWDREVPLRDDGEQPAFSAPAGFANIGFNRADWENGTKDQWYVALYLPKAAFEPLIAAIAEGKVASIIVVLRLKVFTTHHPMAPGARNENLFLRPADPGDTLDWPKHANGYVNSIITKNTLHAIAPPPEPDPYASEDEPNTEIPASAPIPADPVAAAVVALSANVEKLRTSLKWGAGLIFVALLFLVGK
ncbi:MULTISPECIES: hypothetical protein [unclassified Variovorax]|uniref:hypothetical protein n=1 Tax=unclassified Variovorax TaxID=663243 RepID=UPI00076CBA72|nr:MULTISPECIES: hypothetical protein [unclassified Variovorax]KWT97720.1 hypothetical protein APY03_1272 [Variovorax sp. WDL1]PNG48819.1 hypothetical protein CHC06_06560 [Variovorax sp. B2]PNG49326.1 hypothetical protein CHC07_06208 [Variovorax sp. B4]VTV18388.1 hypothetical protein WDL1P2_00116 [Variovorax sp. WDL1]